MAWFEIDTIPLCFDDVIQIQPVLKFGSNDVKKVHPLLTYKQPCKIPMKQNHMAMRVVLQVKQQVW